MAEMKTVTIVPLIGSNYPTWKVQCRMALMKDGLWGIVNESERPPDETSQADKYAKFVARRDRALATIVLAVDPSLLYLLGDPDNPVTIWKKLENQFQKKTWCNKLELRRKLYSLRLKAGGSVQEHIKAMTEIFESLSVIGDPVSDEDRVVYLLASLPDCYNMLVTALEANKDVPPMEVVTERLLHEERKLNDRGSSSGINKAMAAYRHKRNTVICHYCEKPGHIKRNCRKLVADERKTNSGSKHKSDTKPKAQANKATAQKPEDDSSSSSDCNALVVSHALSASATSNWIIDSGATCHMCNDKMLFSNLESLDKPQEVSLGDGHVSKATAQGVVFLEMKLPGGKTRNCKLIDVLYVPKLSYSLLSVSKATESGKTTKFDETGCQILGKNSKIIAAATRVGSLYYLDCLVKQHVSVAQCKEVLWHRRYGHLGTQNLQKLARDKLVDNFDFDASKDIDFCETCVEGKHHRSQFKSNGATRAKEPLGLVHSDVCGKIGTRSLGGANYFLTFIDDKTHYVWVYVLKTKDEVFKYFLDWKTQAEKFSGHQLKVLRTDNGGEYTSKEFENYLKSEGVRHELTVPKTPEQNGVAERLNRTLVEAVRSMLIDANLPHKFWAEALSTAVYLRNRSPAKAVKGMTPFEAWKNIRPKVGHLRVFGCDAFAHIPKDERHKLDAKARKSIFLGYGEETKGYRLYDTTRGRVFYSRDVRFNETKLEKVPKTNEPDTEFLVELDLSNDSETSSKDTEDIQEELPTDNTTEPTLRRSGRERRPPDFYGVEANTVGELQNEPASIEDVLQSPKKDKWMNAMEQEMKSLKENEVWELVELPKDRKTVGCRWVYKLKSGPDGSIDRYKARLVAQGFSQKYGTDYDETFCPVVRLESLRTMIALAVQHGLKLHQVDVTTAFLNGKLEEEVYMRQPEGFVAKGQERLVCKLKKSIYGLKQSPRCWNAALDKQLKDMGFVQSASDPCVYKDSGGEMFLIGVYVDDIILAGKTDKKINEVKRALGAKFNIKDMGKLHYFLGMNILQDEKTGNIWIGQPAYVESILKKFGMNNSKPVSTPIDPNTKLIKATDDEQIIDQQLYQSAIGSLLYLSGGTRPDITFSVSNLAKFSAKPSKHHWTAIKRVMRYLKGTINFGILYTKQKSKNFIAYSDADWAGDLDDRKSTSGYLFQIGGGAVSWRSKKQSSVALSTAEAEYIALASTAQEAVWLRQLTTELGSDSTEAITIFEDNQAAISMSKNPQYHGRAKHISIKYHFIREQVNDGRVTLKYCPTQDMIADMLTKGLHRDQFTKLRKMSGIVSMLEHFVAK